MHLDELLLAAVLILGAVALAVSLFKRLGLGSVLGFLAAGVIVGPSGFSVAENVDDLLHITELGVVLLLFIIGLEMQPQKLWSMRRAVFGLGSAQVIVTGLVIAGAALVFTRMNAWQPAIIVGFGFALSSTAFVMQMLAERGEMNTPHGQAAFSVLLLQDIAIVPLLALVPILAGGDPETASGAAGWLKALQVMGAILLVLVFGRYVIPFALDWTAKRRNMEGFYAIAMFSAIGAAWLMEVTGLSMALGAFLVGMMLSGSDYRHQVEAAVEPYKGAMIGLFFITVGMSIDLNLLVERFVGVSVLVVVLILIKLVILFGLALAFGHSRARAVRIAAVLSQMGEFGFVLFGAAKVIGLIPDLAYVIALLTISVSMALTPLLVKLGDIVADRLEPLPESGDQAAAEMDRHVIIAGYGRVGNVVATMLERSGVPYVAYDLDPGRVAHGKKLGHEVHFGDLTKTEILTSAGIGRSAAVVVTLQKSHDAERLASTLKNFYPGTAIHALVHDLADQPAMLAKGAVIAVPETTEGSLRLGRSVLESLGVTEDAAQELLGDLRSGDYEALRQAVKPTDG